jgi:hypothetical protein
MSVVTNLLLKVSTVDTVEPEQVRAFHGLAAVQAWCRGEDPEPRLRWPSHEVTHVSGGTKNLEIGLWAWGANYLDLGGFLEAVRTALWQRPDEVQVLAQEQDQDRFQVWTLQVPVHPDRLKRRHWRHWMHWDGVSPVARKVYGLTPFLNDQQVKVQHPDGRSSAFTDRTGIVCLQRNERGDIGVELDEPTEHDWTYKRRGRNGRPVCFIAPESLQLILKESP